MVRVRFTNRLDEPTTIHWHGIRLPIEMDGVPYISQPPVQPGESFIYQFKTQDAGSYWYHPHLMSSEQLGRGLVGPLIIEEREPTGFRHEKVLCLKTWHVDEQGAFTPFSVPRQAAREGTRGRYSTINGKHVPTIDLPAGQIVRVRLLNVDNTVTYRLNLPNGEARIYAIDGHPVEPRGFEGQYWIGPGMRLELALKVPEAGTELSLRDGPVRLATIRNVASAEAPAGDWPKPLPANPVSEPDLANAEKIGFRFEWVGAMSDTSGKNPYPSFWQINGKAWEGGEGAQAQRAAAGQAQGRPELHLRAAQHGAVPAPDPPAWDGLQGAGFGSPGHHPVLHRHLPAGQERDCPRRAGGGQSACGCSTATSSTIWRPA